MIQLGAGWRENQPRPTTKLKRGRAIGAKSHAGFVDTFNWMLAWIVNFNVGAGLRFSGGEVGQPKLDLNLIDGNGVPVSDGDPDQPYDITDGVEGDGGTTIPGPFEPVYTDGVLSGFANCIYCAERQFVECGTGGAMTISGVTANTSGYVVLTLPHDASASSSADVIDNANVSVAIEQSLPTNTSGTQTKIPLFHITNGVIDVDLRAVPTGVLAR